MLQIAAESEAADDELIRKAAGFLMGGPGEVAEGSGSVPADSGLELGKVS